LKDLDPSLLDYPMESGPTSGFPSRSDEFQTKTYEKSSRFFNETPVRSPQTISGTPLSSTGKPLQKVKHQPTLQTTVSTGAGFASDTTGLTVGSIIAHERFGKGLVKSLEGSGDNAKVEVEFETSGYKKLLLKFARFTILS
jgi:DNA helicase-2/ATP-dependent DNA helicase PcrA